MSVAVLETQGYRKGAKKRLDRIMGEQVAANPQPDATADDAASILSFGSVLSTGGEGGADAVGSDV
ncbi:hypothetical protein PsorP6_010246 [Peronosclerospora sorghi]|uniref:Uncharacterized protein n=1 Tax=Peronosclerospora sorghi TaxID=230839 RepID=A0ACC0VWI3_9STRA|nr:hypothetical protein PsorP6_010246 [Peronosclerospora sorghi]